MLRGRIQALEKSEQVADEKSKHLRIKKKINSNDSSTKVILFHIIIIKIV